MLHGISGVHYFGGVLRLGRSSGFFKFIPHAKVFDGDFPGWRDGRLGVFRWSWFLGLGFHALQNRFFHLDFENPAVIDGHGINKEVF